MQQKQERETLHELVANARYRVVAIYPSTLSNVTSAWSFFLPSLKRSHSLTGQLNVISQVRVQHSFNSMTNGYTSKFTL